MGQEAYRRNRNPVWLEFACAEHNDHINDHIHFGNADYFLSADGLLMPTKKGQPAPDLKYFEPTKK